MIYLKWLLGAWLLLVIIAVWRTRAENKRRPKCPVHKMPMELYSDWYGVESFNCREKGCKECADKYDDDGTVRHFRTQ